MGIFDKSYSYTSNISAISTNKYEVKWKNLLK